jgi:hypothetical protein
MPAAQAPSARTPIMSAQARLTSGRSLVGHSQLSLFEPLQFSSTSMESHTSVAAGLRRIVLSSQSVPRTSVGVTVTRSTVRAPASVPASESLAISTPGHIGVAVPERTLKHDLLGNPSSSRSLSPPRPDGTTSPSVHGLQSSSTPIESHTSRALGFLRGLLSSQSSPPHAADGCPSLSMSTHVPTSAIITSLTTASTRTPVSPASVGGAGGAVQATLAAAIAALKYQTVRCFIVACTPSSLDRGRTRSGCNVRAVSPLRSHDESPSKRMRYFERGTVPPDSRWTLPSSAAVDCIPMRADMHGRAPIQVQRRDEESTATMDASGRCCGRDQRSRRGLSSPDSVAVSANSSAARHATRIVYFAAELAHGRQSIRGLFAERSHDRVAQRRGDRAVELRQVRRRRAQHARDDLRQARSFEWESACQARIEHHAHRPLIGAVVERPVAAGLLGGHVRGSSPRAFPCACGRALRLRRPSRCRSRAASSASTCPTEARERCWLA